MKINYFFYIKTINYFCFFLSFFSDSFCFDTLININDTITMDIPFSVNKALIEFSQCYAYAHVYSYMFYYPFWFTLFFSLNAGFAAWLLYALYFNLQPGMNDLVISFMFFIYVFIKVEFPYKNFYALRVNETAILIYNKIILELSKLDEDTRASFYEEFFSIYISESLPNEIKFLFLLQIIEKLL